MSTFVVKVVVVVFLGVIIGASLFSAPYLSKLKEIKRKSEVKINNQTIVVEVVKTDKDREQGLSGRDNLGINEGMLFLFENPGNHGIWMKGMKFPIDIIWISGNEIIGFEENVEPEPGVGVGELTVYYPPETVNKVLELKAGRVSLLRVRVDDEVKIRPLVPGLN
ncbi:MAG: DUF192 domain-containing protein [Patescibacteria group bacterium]|nr:DUF192 domain-containing protein [Patescibacteria group bacterium]